jgi:hypothetical protein
MVYRCSIAIPKLKYSLSLRERAGVRGKLAIPLIRALWAPSPSKEKD